MSAVLARIKHHIARIKKAVTNALRVVKRRVNAILEAILDAVVTWVCKRSRRPIAC